MLLSNRFNKMSEESSDERNQDAQTDPRSQDQSTRLSKIKLGVFFVFILTIVSLCIKTITVGLDTSNVYDEIADAFLGVVVFGVLIRTTFALYKRTRATDKPAETLNKIIIVCFVSLCVIFLGLSVLNKFTLFRKQPPSGSPGPAPMPIPPGPAPMPMPPGPAPMPMPPGPAPFPIS